MNECLSHEPATADLADDQLLTLDQACEMILRGAIKKGVLRRAIANGQLVAMRLGNRIFVTPAGIRDWLRSREMPPAPRLPPRPKFLDKRARDSQAAFKAALNALRRGVRAPLMTAREMRDLC